MPTSFNPSMTGKWRMRCLCMSFFRLDHGHVLRAGRGLARHEVPRTCMLLGEPGPVLGESAHDIALGDRFRRRVPLVVAGQAADVERAEARGSSRT